MRKAPRGRDRVRVSMLRTGAVRDTSLAGGRDLD